ncbi:MAG: hypothetical protein U9R17_01390 [Thermodesulfobacteriota bacterium]|nr:hypothetical protein [Thermodesulfobacteriota bacterium]
MVRPLSVEYPGAWYHVTSRAIEKSQFVAFRGINNLWHRSQVQPATRTADKGSSFRVKKKTEIASQKGS